GSRDKDAGAVGDRGAADGIGAKVVSEHDIAAGARIHQHAKTVVAGNEVASCGGGAADGVVGSYHFDSIHIGQGSSGHIESNVIALHQGATAEQLDAIIAVTGDDVASAGDAAAQRIAGAAVADADEVAQRVLPGIVGAYIVALYHV